MRELDSRMSQFGVTFRFAGLMAFSWAEHRYRRRFSANINDVISSLAHSSHLSADVGGERPFDWTAAGQWRQEEKRPRMRGA
jgi:hypothetical protein